MRINDAISRSSRFYPVSRSITPFLGPRRPVLAAIARPNGSWVGPESALGIDSTVVFDLLTDGDEIMAAHAFVGASMRIHEDTIEVAFRQLGDDRRRSAGVVQAIILSGHDPVDRLVKLLRSTAAAPKSRPEGKIGSGGNVPWPQAPNHKQFSTAFSSVSA